MRCSEPGHRVQVAIHALVGRVAELGSLGRMEALAIILQLLRFILAALAVYFCVALFRHHRRVGWLLLSALFAEPFLLLLMRLLKGGSFFASRTVRSGDGEILEVTYRLEFPILYYVAFIGLFMLFREARRDNAA